MNVQKYYIVFKLSFDALFAKVHSFNIPSVLAVTTSKLFDVSSFTQDN